MICSQFRLLVTSPSLKTIWANASGSLTSFDESCDAPPLSLRDDVSLFSFFFHPSFSFLGSTLLSLPNSKSTDAASVVPLARCTFSNPSRHLMAPANGHTGSSTELGPFVPFIRHGFGPDERLRPFFFPSKPKSGRVQNTICDNLTHPTLFYTALQFFPPPVSPLPQTCFFRSALFQFSYSFGAKGGLSKYRVSGSLFFPSLFFASVLATNCSRLSTPRKQNVW